MWNVYQASIDGSIRTNNHVEAWHSKFAKLMNSHHPNIWKFLSQLQKEQQENENQFIQMRGGHRRIRYPLRIRYQEQERIIRNIVMNYDEYKDNEDVDTYLTAIAYRLKKPSV